MPDAQTGSAYWNTLQEERIVVLRGPIDDDLANTVIASLLFLADQDPTSPIHLHIDSPGGGLTNSLAIYDTIDEVQPPVHTHGMRHVAGTALLLLAHGARGHRSATTPASLDFGEVLSGGHDDDPAELRRWRSILTRLYASDTRKTEAALAEIWRQPRRFGAAQAMSYGLIDHVVRPVEE